MKMLLRSRNVLPLGLIVLSLICRPAGAQWLKVPARAIPRTSDGKPNLAAPAAPAGGWPPRPVGNLGTQRQVRSESRGGPETRGSSVPGLGESAVR